VTLVASTSAAIACSAMVTTGWDSTAWTSPVFRVKGVRSWHTTACVFGWEERADESGRFMRKEIQAYVDKYFR
jgi:hypothetical protein